MALKKSDIKPLFLPEEALAVPELGGEVIVRGLLLRDRLALFADVREGADRFGHLARLLAATVIDADGRQVFTADEWEVFGARHFDAALKIFEVSRRLSGLDAEEREKN